MTIVADLAKEEAPAQIVKEAVEKLGGCILQIQMLPIQIQIFCYVDNLEVRNYFFSGLDVLVNSAGILMSGSVETLAVADYDKVRMAATVLLKPTLCAKKKDK